MDFQPEDRPNQIWVRKSGSRWSANELVDTINFVHLVVHHGYDSFCADLSLRLKHTAGSVRLGHRF